MQLPSGFSGGIFFVPRGGRRFFWGICRVSGRFFFEGKKQLFFLALEVLGGWWFILWIGICEMFLWFADMFLGRFGSFVFAAMAGRGEGTFIGFSFLARTLGAAQPFRSTLFALQTRCYGIRVTAPRLAGRGRGMC